MQEEILDSAESTEVQNEEVQNENQVNDTQNTDKNDEPKWAKELKNDLSKWKTKARELENKVKVYEDEKLTEQEKNVIKLKQAEESLQKTKNKLIDKQIALVSKNHNVIDDEIISKLLDYNKFEMNDDGEIENLDELVKELLDKKSYLKKDNKESKEVYKPAKTNPDSETVKNESKYIHSK